MRNPARLLAVAAICAVALWSASAPVSALTVSIGGEQPTVPLPLPLPIGANATVGDGNGLQVGVHAPPASTDIDVHAGKSGVDAKAKVADTPLLDVHAGPASLPQVPAPADGSAPVVATPTPADPVTGGTPTPADAPAHPRPAARPDSSDHHTAAPGVRAGDAESVGGVEISTLPRSAREGTPEVAASIAASPHAGYLAALPRLGARLLLWLALAGAVIALRFFVGSATTRATRAS